jgi:DNA polymerase III subunit epsilon
MPSSPAVDPERVARYLEENCGYKVLRPLAALPTIGESSGRPAKVLVVAALTNGLDPGLDQLVELAAVSLEVDSETGVFQRRLAQYIGLQDPGVPIRGTLSAQTGITSQTVHGHHLDEAAVIQLADGADLVIAHGAAHVRPFLEARFPLFEKLAWACSQREIDWGARGVASSELAYLAFRCGFFAGADRAGEEAHSLSRIVSLMSLDSAGAATPLQLLIAASLTSEYVIHATGAPFEARDTLRAHGYEWNGELKVWQVTARDDAQFDSQAQWLKRTIFGQRPAKVQVEVRDAYLKHSRRSGPVNWHSIGPQGDRSSIAGRY